MSKYRYGANFEWKPGRLEPGKIARLYRVVKWRFWYLAGRTRYHPTLNDWNFILFKY